MTLRAAGDDDTEAVFALGVAEEHAWFGEAELTAAEVGEWVEEEGGVRSGVVAVDEHGRVCGFASQGRRQAVLLADPAPTRSPVDELLRWLGEQGGDLEVVTYAGDAARVAALERHGLRHLRSSFQLAHHDDAGPLPAAAIPPGIRVAAYRLGEDDDAVHRLVYVDAAWASVPGHTERDLDEWRQVAGPCESMFVGVRGDRPVAWVAGRLMANGRGWVATLAVAIGERRHGLGRAMLLHAFADLQRLGARDLGLAVEASNDAALGLYRSVGLEVEREWRTYGTAGSGDRPAASSPTS